HDVHGIEGPAREAGPEGAPLGRCHVLIEGAEARIGRDNHPRFRCNHHRLPSLALLLRVPCWTGSFPGSFCTGLPRYCPGSSSSSSNGSISTSTILRTAPATRLLPKPHPL